MPYEMNGAHRAEPGASSGDPAQPSANAALKHAAARLLQLLDRETEALRRRQPVDMDDLSNRKNQALLELTRIGRTVDGNAMDDQLRFMLGELRKKLDENQTVLKLHLQAVGEVADILAAAIRDADSDGTYSTGPSQRWLA